MRSFGFFVLFSIAVGLLIRTLIHRRDILNLQKRLLDNRINNKTVMGVKAWLRLHSPRSKPKLLTRYGWSAQRKFVSTVGQLYHPSDMIYPLLKDPLPLSCEWLVYGQLALIHPETGVIFGIRLGSYLNLVRMGREDEAAAIQANAVWRDSKVPNQLDVKPVDLLDEGWFCVNESHPQLFLWMRRAFDSAGHLTSAQ